MQNPANYRHLFYPEVQWISAEPKRPLWYRAQEGWRAFCDLRPVAIFTLSTIGSILGALMVLTLASSKACAQGGDAEWVQKAYATRTCEWTGY